MLMEWNDASRDGIGHDAWNGGECVASPGERCARVSPNKDNMDMDQDDASSVDTSSSDEGWYTDQDTKIRRDPDSKYLRNGWFKDKNNFNPQRNASLEGETTVLVWTDDEDSGTVSNKNLSKQPAPTRTYEYNNDDTENQYLFTDKMYGIDQRYDKSSYPLPSHYLHFLRDAAAGPRRLRPATSRQILTTY